MITVWSRLMDGLSKYQYSTVLAIATIMDLVWKEMTVGMRCPEVSLEIRNVFNLVNCKLIKGTSIAEVLVFVLLYTASVRLKQ